LKATVSKLGDAVDVLSGFAYEAEHFNQTEGMPLIRIRDVVRGFSNTRYSGEVDAKFIVQNGEILIGMDGNFNTARWTGGPALLNQRVCKVTARAGILDEGFLFHLLPKELKKIEDATAFVTVKHLSVKGIRDIDVALPPLPEQRRIAAILDQADALRAKRREALAQLDSLTQSIFIEMFGDPVTNSKRLPTKFLNQIAKFENGDRSSNYPSGDDIKDHGVLFLSTKNITDGRLDLTKSVYITEEKFKSLSRGKAVSNDLIITLRGTLGSCCIFDTVHKTAFINAQMMIVRPLRECDSMYLHALLTSKQAQERFDHIGRGAAVPQLTAAQMASLEIPVPPLAEQQEFARRMKALDELKDKQEIALTELDTLFASIQNRAFRGDL
jgi:type I restriction enzyme S subunit